MSAPETARSGSRWRLVTLQNKRSDPAAVSRHISSVVLSEDEAGEAVEIEAQMHREAGWTVTEDDGSYFIANKGNIMRFVEAQQFDPLDDSTF